MDKIPFSAYDFWAYFCSGAFLLVLLDVLAGTNLLGKDAWTVAQTAVAVAAAYATGHLVAGLSSWSLEQGLVGKVLGNPRDILLGLHRGSGWLRRLIPGYYKPLPDDPKYDLFGDVDNPNTKEGVEELFLKAFAAARSDSVVMGRLEGFKNMYGFCRNIALVALVGGILIAKCAEMYVAGLGLFLFGLAMTLRYLKFFRLYAQEVLTAYAYRQQS